ncbi:uncharacterized protein LOC8084286 [Sorghum bicolor]|uniref:Uncharacterized protein n=1 Tax=Sorghum bicolor TaxID=4558 RepID=C5X828_SORBI|nr:uncharacterized protein LOC8084286 [Sorghum bicolor]EER97893.1 hypothetical protein SORBI_3002G017800 [Sorghum bicolor]|eukprot:XP_002461372.1 uncharacterized protein LOC8084286 [Sorghum bicolor]
MKLVWCPDTASKAYIDGVRAIANVDSADASPELAELLAAMAGGWNARLIVDAPDSASSTSTTTSLALAAAARRTGGRYARLDVVDDAPAPPTEDEATTNSGSGSGSGSSSSSFSAAAATEAAMARLEGVDLLVLDARRRDAAVVLRAARPGPRGMVVVVRHGGGGVRRRAAAAPPWWGMLAAGTRVVRAAYLPIGAGGVEVLHVGVGKGPSLLPTTQHSRRPSGGGRGRWIRHVNHRTGEEHVFRRQ